MRPSQCCGQAGFHAFMGHTNDLAQARDVDVRASACALKRLQRWLCCSRQVLFVATVKRPGELACADTVGAGHGGPAGPQQPCCKNTSPAPMPLKLR